MDKRVAHCRPAAGAAVRLVAVFVGWIAVSARAENVAIRIRAVNPAETNRTTTVSSRLPRGIDPRTDIVDSGEMKIRYDAENGVYLAEAEVAMGPRQTRDFAVVLKDIWTVPQERLDELRRHAEMLVGELSKTKRKETAATLLSRVGEGLTAIAEHQNKYSVRAARVAEHVSAYGKTEKLLKRVREDICMLENLAVGEGIDPKSFRGVPPPVPEKEKEEKLPPSKPALMKIMVRNPGSTERVMTVKRYLPQEVRPEDVDPGKDLEVRYDAEKHACYVFKQDAVVGPGESLVFEIAVTNRWVLDPARLSALWALATNVQAKAELGKIEALKSEAARVLGRLQELRSAQPPADLNEEYIADYRGRLRVADEAEASIARIDQLLRPRQHIDIFKAEVLERVQPPSRSTTWIIVYIVLGFLALMSVLFFLRWHGKSKDETL